MDWGTLHGRGEKRSRYDPLKLALRGLATYDRKMKPQKKVQPMVILLLLSGTFITSGSAQEEETSNLSEVVAEVQGVTITQED